jgi:hypothetical protein
LAKKVIFKTTKHEIHCTDQVGAFWCLLQVDVACGEDGAVKGLGQGKGYVHQVIFVATRGADLSNVEFGVAIE